jgi:hypothetical protein
MLAKGKGPREGDKVEESLVEAQIGEIDRESLFLNAAGTY